MYSPHGFTFWLFSSPLSHEIVQKCNEREDGAPEIVGVQPHTHYARLTFFKIPTTSGWRIESMVRRLPENPDSLKYKAGKCRTYSEYLGLADEEQSRGQIDFHLFPGR